MAKAKAYPHRCGTCRFYDVPEGKQRRKGNVYRCIAPAPPTPGLPASITAHHAYRAPADLIRMWMGPFDGPECPAWAVFTPTPKDAPDA